MPSEEKIAKRLEAVRWLAAHYGWQEVQFDVLQDLVAFKHPEKPELGRVNVWYTKMTVGTALEHPHKGKTQLFRKRVNGKTLAKIFQNPRTHTGRGYYTREENERREMYAEIRKNRRA